MLATVNITIELVNGCDCRIVPWIYLWYNACVKFYKLVFVVHPTKERAIQSRVTLSFLVEAGRIEPPSGTISTGFSTGVACNLFTLFRCVCRRTHRAGLLHKSCTSSKLWRNGAGV